MRGLIASEAERWHQRARVATGVDPRPGAFVVLEPAAKLTPVSSVAPLAQRIEDGIRDRVDARLADALAAARDAAFRAYADALRPLCGRPFDVVVVDVMGCAEEALANRAREAAIRIETESVLKQLQDAQPGEASE